MPAYKPPYNITPIILTLVADISEQLGRWSALLGDDALSPQLRRGNRIRTIQASLAIEHNSLTLEQVTALLDGKRVLGLPREIQEVRNAFTAYEKLPDWQAHNPKHLLAAHDLLMQGLVDDAGQWRQTGVGIYRDQLLIHMAPPPSQVVRLISDLLVWLEKSAVHPLVASCIFHYEFEFIHPFSDGNGRMGRLWQTLILSKWKTALAYLPVETVICQQQADYYAALSAADKASDATGFIEYMLQALLVAMQEVVLAQIFEVEAPSRQQVGTKSDLNADQIRLLAQFNGEMSLLELMAILKRADRSKFRQNILMPLIDAGLVEATIPDKPTSSKQKYRLIKRE
ncbi:Fic family protein [Methylomonas sp. AM2-LC]|uniref:Fic family protein n=1 Tax=Methylomonas sp. AM2-LC TaxID=3153301 RepID=UPI0032655691